MARKVFDYSTQGDIYIESPGYLSPIYPAELEKESPYLSAEAEMDQESFDEEWANRPQSGRTKRLAKSH